MAWLFGSNSLRIAQHAERYEMLMHMNRTAWNEFSFSNISMLSLLCVIKHSQIFKECRKQPIELSVGKSKEKEVIEIVDDVEEEKKEDNSADDDECKVERVDDFKQAEGKKKYTKKVKEVSGNSRSRTRTSIYGCVRGKM